MSDKEVDIYGKVVGGGEGRQTLYNLSMRRKLWVEFLEEKTF